MWGKKGKSQSLQKSIKIQQKRQEAGWGPGVVGKQGGRWNWKETGQQFSRIQQHTEIKDMIQCLPNQQIQQTFH